MLRLLRAAGAVEMVRHLLEALAADVALKDFHDDQCSSGSSVPADSFGCRHGRVVGLGGLAVESLWP
jgi:hypothetical protein